ncbi:MAG: hypothetical protein ACLP7O_03220, partial [Terracidiphilus sp.]
MNTAQLFLALACSAPLFGQGKVPTRQSDADAILLQARSEPVEIEAYVFRQLRGQRRSITQTMVSETLDRLRDRAHSAQTWYPRFPVTSIIPEGYSGLLSASKFDLSGLSIFLGTLGPELPISTLRRMLASLPRGAPEQATCDVPVFRSRLPLFHFVAQHWQELYPTAYDQLTGFGGLASQIDSAFDLANFLDLTLQVNAKSHTDVAVPLSYAASALDRLTTPACGGNPLQVQFGFGVMMDRAITLAKDYELSETLLTKYRDFVARSVGQSICTIDGRPDSNETTARRRLVDSVNKTIASSGPEHVSKISQDEVTRREQERVLLGKQSRFSMDHNIKEHLKQQRLAIMPFMMDPQFAASNPVQLDIMAKQYLADWQQWNPGEDEL